MHEPRETREVNLAQNIFNAKRTLSENSTDLKKRTARSLDQKRSEGLS